MIKGLIALIIITTLISLGITNFRMQTGLERWALIKTVSYSIMCAVIALSILGSIVLLF